MMYVLEEIVRVWLSMTQMGGGMRIPQSVRISLSSEMDMGIDETTVKPLSINCRTKGVLKAEVKELIVKNLYSPKWNEGGFEKYNLGYSEPRDRITASVSTCTVI